MFYSSFRFIILTQNCGKFIFFACHYFVLTGFAINSASIYMLITCCFSIHFNFVKGILTRVFKSLCFVTKCLVLVAFSWLYFLLFSSLTLFWYIVQCSLILILFSSCFSYFHRLLSKRTVRFQPSNDSVIFSRCSWLT